MTDTLKKLMLLSNALELGDGALDDAVYDCVEEGRLAALNSTDDVAEQERIIVANEEEASAINDGGPEAQIEYLLEHNDDATVEGLIRARAEVNEQLVTGKWPTRDGIYNTLDSLEQLVGKTVEAVTAGKVVAAYGDEPSTTLWFTDGTYVRFVHPADEDRS